MEAIRVERSEGLVTVALDRPEKKNAIDAAIWNGLDRVLAEVALDPNDVKKSRIDLQAGMPAEVIVPTRPRTLFEYLLGPLRDEITRAFRER